MLGEPVLLGLLVTPSLAGFGVALVATFGFLARHPAKLALADWRQRRRTPRTRMAVSVACVYAMVGGCGLVLASGGATGWWMPLAIAAPPAFVQLAYDVRHRGRRLLPEVLGAVALGSVAASELWAASWPAARAFAAWALLAVKAVAAILYVRARLRVDRDLPVGLAAPLVAHALLLATALGLAFAGLAPWLAAAGAALLLARAGHGLSAFHRHVPPQVVGMMEVGYGLVFVLIAAVGYARQL